MIQDMIQYMIKTATTWGDVYATGFLLVYHYSNKHYKIIAIDLSKQKSIDADLQEIQQINFTGNLDEDKNITMFFITEDRKKLS